MLAATAPELVCKMMKGGGMEAEGVNCMCKLYLMVGSGVSCVCVVCCAGLS